MTMKKNWLVFANRDSCHHAEALHDLGFVNWKEGRCNMSIGDIVYMYVSDERRIRFKTQVVGEGCIREDGKYWQKPYTSDLTYKLALIDEYTGHELNDVLLRKHGFKGGKSIERPMYNNPELFQYIESVWGKQNYGHIIDNLVPQEKSRELVRKIIPILIRWAKQGQTSRTYDDLTKELGYSRFSGIGKQLGYIDDVFKEFGEMSGEKIPTLNALVKSKSSGLPSTGFSYVYTSYDDMSEDEKKIFVMGLNKEALEYKQWDWVLSSLGLTPSVINTTALEAVIRSGKFHGKGGEGENHKKLKEYIYGHPEDIGIKDVVEKDTERILLSGDRLDVYFKQKDGTCIAVEVKPSTSPDEDIMRGIFQCVKYKAIMDSEDKVHGKKLQNKSILVIGGNLSTVNMQIRDTLGIQVIEKFEGKEL